nr:MAG TPA: hypothetical protein [Caudoviricetes sp.]
MTRITARSVSFLKNITGRCLYGKIETKLNHAHS